MMSTFFAAFSWTALRPSSGVVIQKGTSVRPFSGAVMPRPAVKRRAMPGTVFARCLNVASVPSSPMLNAALTPKYARRRRSVSSSGAVVLVCTWASTIAGITVLPARLTRVAPAGALIVAPPPA